ncbi:MAG: hypothetical protein ABS911_00560 [Carnobacterium sp.]|uniref:hypothetical protein n=1 Tax=Carnobacterium sp. TaxID=48221 RepID=UPI0033151DFF
MKKCVNCGKSIKDDVSFCIFCGEKQDVTKIEKKDKKSQKMGLKAGVVILILVLVGVVGFNYYQEATAKNTVAHLFDSSNTLNESITEDDIAIATKKVNHVNDSKLKKKLSIDVAAATSMIAVVEGSKEVLNDENILNEKSTIKELDSIKESLEKVKTYSPTFYKEYTEIYSTAQEQYNLHTNLEKEIESVYNDGTIKGDTTRDEYEGLVSMNESVKNVTLKEIFTAKLNEIEEVMEKIEEEKASKNTANLTEDEMTNRILAYYFSKSDITDDSSKVKFSVDYSSTPNTGTIMYYNPGSMMGMGKGNYTVSENGDFQLTNFAFEEIEHQYDGNILDEVSQEMIDAIPKYATSSFMGTWTTDNLLITITEESVVVAVQESGNGMFGEIIDQTFDKNSNTLAVSLFSSANPLDGIPQDKYLDLEFKLKEIGGKMYIEYEGEDYISNDGYGL